MIGTFYLFIGIVFAVVSLITGSIEWDSDLSMTIKFACVAVFAIVMIIGWPLYLAMLWWCATISKEEEENKNERE